jgi:predicted AlkP superfamily pyrophosphatase or phosphodiesterase
MNRFALVLFVLIVAPFVSAADSPATQPADAPRVLIVSIDGCRPDMLLRARTPNVHALMEAGSFSLWARTTPLAITLPSHTSMLTGVIPRKHEIEWNKDLPLREPVYPAFPTLFELAHKHGYTTAMAAGKSKFVTLAKPGTLDWQSIPSTEKSEDPDVADAAVRIVREHQPQVLFVHLPTTDNVGHAKGWGTDDQLAAIEQADDCLGRVLSALDFVGQRRKTFIIVTADHGGAGRTHVPDDPRARYIPWIAVGPGIRKNLDLTTFADLVINTEDTFATAASILKLPLDKRLDGKPVKEILDKQELLEAR